jgi:hypothetical protein
VDEVEAVGQKYPAVHGPEQRLDERPNALP